MKALAEIGLVVLLLLLVVGVFAAAIGLGMGVWRWMRWSLYNRELTPQEQWAEGAQEADMNEEEWSATLAGTDAVKSKRNIDSATDKV
jgi:hypothetical protein